LIRKSVICPDKISKDLQRDLAAGGVVTDSSKVWHRLLDMGRTARRPIQRQLLTTKMIKTQMQ
jgi:hypothetical protein